MTALELAAFAYAATLICVMIVEIAPLSRSATRAAVASLVFALTGSSAWCYAAFFEPSQWPDFGIERSADASERTSARRSKARAAEEGEDEDDEGPAGKPGSGRSGRDHGEGGETAAGDIPDEEYLSARRRRKLLRSLGLAGGDLAGGDGANASGARLSGATLRDCATCPVMLIVPAGSASIGADDDDTAAEAAERPARSVRVWPGFAISQRAIDRAIYDQFRVETGLGRERCQAETASIAQSASVTEPASSEDNPKAPETCVTAQAAESFATWLSLRTGKRYRLPSAIEWEYAAKMLPAPGMKTSDVAEIVGDCWQHRLPRADFELIAVQTRGFDCGGRMLKGGSPRHPSAWHRLSARHELATAASYPEAGFRVMRALD
jgi:formylglycine-generating enzyme required for sulfatase activity